MHKNDSETSQFIYAVDIAVFKSQDFCVITLTSLYFQYLLVLEQVNKILCHLFQWEVADIIAQQFSKGCENLWSPVISDWKLVSIISIYKKGLRKDKENYRHVSLISMPEKIHG